MRIFSKEFLRSWSGAYSKYKYSLFCFSGAFDSCRSAGYEVSLRVAGLRRSSLLAEKYDVGLHEIEKIR